MRPDAVRIAYRIVDRETGEMVGAYSRAYHDEYDFTSEEEARNANVHGVFKDRGRYDVKKFVVVSTEVKEGE